MGPWALPVVAGLLVGLAAACLKPWLAALVVLAPTFLAILIAAAWARPVLGLAALALMIPFQFRLPFSKNWSLASGLALTALLALLWLCSRLAAGRPWMVWQVPMGVALMAFASGLSLLVAAEPMLSIKKLIYLSGFLVLFVLVPNLVATPRQLALVMRAVVWSGGLTALAGIVQFAAQFHYGPLAVMDLWKSVVVPVLEGPNAAETVASRANWAMWIGGVPVMRAVGPFISPQEVIYFMAFCTPLALVGALAGQPKVGQAVSLPGLADGQADSPPHPRLPLAGVLPLFPLLAMLVFLAITFSRQAWIAAPLMVMTLLVVGTRFRPFSARLGWAVLIGALVIGMLVAAAPESTLATRLFSIIDRKERSNLERLEAWSDGLYVVEHYPVLGTGVGNFFTALDRETGFYAHNAYLNVWAETGPLGIIGLLLLLGWAWWSAARIFAEARDPTLRIFGLASLGTMSWLTVLFIFDDAIYSPRSGPSFWLELGLLVAARRMLGGERCTS
jgi:O-antigen ligase